MVGVPDAWPRESFDKAVSVCPNGAKVRPAFAKRGFVDNPC